MISILKEAANLWESLNNIGKSFVLLVVFIFAFALTALIDFVLVDHSYVVSVVEVNGSITSEDKDIPPTSIPTSTPRPLKTNPINGVKMEVDEYKVLKKQNPVAIIVNNHQQARPLYGIGQADSVLEVLAEGGITRLVAVYYQNRDVEKIGPVRSLRYYMIEFASEYADAVLLHHGWAGFDNADFETYRERTDARGAVSRLGVRSLQTVGSAYRDLTIANQNGYVHALFTDFTRINSELDRLNSQGLWQVNELPETLSFKEDFGKSNRGSVARINITFTSLNSTPYNVSFAHNNKTNTYDRSVGGVADIDALSQKQISPKNVIVEWHNYQDANDGHSRIIIDMIGEGPVQIFRDRKVIEGVWKKGCLTCRTKYYYNNGQPIKLNRGQIWVVNAIKVGERLVSQVNFQ